VKKVKNFIKDVFFAKGHFLLKLWQFIFTLLMWLPVLLPIMITANSTIFKEVEDQFYRWNYRGGFVLYQHLTVELALALVGIFVIAILLTHRTNYRTTHQYQQKIMYDEVKLAQKKAALEKIYAERFGTAAFREQANYYSVDPEQNLPDDCIKKVFQKLEE
jgi:hypothetical protein